MAGRQRAPQPRTNDQGPRTNDEGCRCRNQEPQAEQVEPGVRWLRHRLAAGVTSGLVLWTTFPPLEWGFLAWIALTPLFWLVTVEALQDVPGRLGRRTGLLDPWPSPGSA